MGSGIAQVFALHGFAVTLFDVNATALVNARHRILQDLSQQVSKNRITENEKSEMLSLLKFSDQLSDCRANLVIEAVVEDKQIKTELLQQLFRINGNGAIIVSNTSSLALSDLVIEIPFPEKFAGMHFFNPAPVMKLVEIVRTPYTGQEEINQLLEITRAIKKIPVVCKDSPGFIVNRVARPYYLEALYLCEKEIGDINIIDRLMENTGFRMGPFKLMDLIGNDINYSVTCIVYEALDKPERLTPSQLQQAKVQQGMLGRKTGKGYYEYSR